MAHTEEQKCRPKVSLYSTVDDALIKQEALYWFLFLYRVCVCVCWWRLPAALQLAIPLPAAGAVIDPTFIFRPSTDVNMLISSFLATLVPKVFALDAVDAVPITLANQVIERKRCVF